MIGSRHRADSQPVIAINVKQKNKLKRSKLKSLSLVESKMRMGLYLSVPNVSKFFWCNDGHFKQRVL
jgi:hypothetical protein